jgi:co-chaperonin GroES (HSP10)
MFLKRHAKENEMKFDVSAVDLSGIINATTQEKARQVPDPVTYHLLCMLPKAEEELSESGIVKTSTMMHHEELLSPVLFVAKMGPDAYKDEKRFPSGPSCQVGDFILVRPNTGTRMKIHGTEWRLIADESVEAVIQDPRGIQRP